MWGLICLFYLSRKRLSEDFIGKMTVRQKKVEKQGKGFRFLKAYHENLFDAGTSGSWKKCMTNTRVEFLIFDIKNCERKFKITEVFAVTVEWDFKWWELIAYLMRNKRFHSRTIFTILSFGRWTVLCVDVDDIVESWQVIMSLHGWKNFYLCLSDDLKSFSWNSRQTHTKKNGTKLSLIIEQTNKHASNEWSSWKRAEE